jgi:hypothetical protein
MSAMMACVMLINTPKRLGWEQASKEWHFRHFSGSLSQMSDVNIENQNCLR